MAAALLLLLAATATCQQLGDLTRRDTGDTFQLFTESCGPAQCAEHGAGVWDASTADVCLCACPQRAPLFREDRELCVDDLPECSLATFGNGIGIPKIPFVYLPLKGQIIHPSKEITFPGVKTPICAVSGAQFLTKKGFVDLRNTVDADVPFSLFRDEGRTFLQWSGEDELRSRMSGRVMVVRLLCRDVSATLTSPIDLRGVFTPCVAFRLQGTPPRQSSNITEVQFASNAHTSEASMTSGLSISEYIAIGISSVLLGLIYVASVFLYLHLRKRRNNTGETTKKVKAFKKKDGTSITEHDIVRINNERIQSISGPMVEDEVIVKKNPLLTMSRQCHDIKTSIPDSSSNLSDSDDFTDGLNVDENNRTENQIISAIIHDTKSQENETRESPFRDIRDESTIERLPDEQVSIVETTDDRDIARPVGTTRRKLYFNPAYFEPDLMADPPQAALEFLTKIREVISIAKHKMASKRFQPILNEIPEEETYPSNGNSLDIYQGIGSQRSGSVLSLKKENSRKKSITCVGCPGCKSDENSSQNFSKYNIPACSNCVHERGDKQNSIRQWLENIPTIKQVSNYDFLPNDQNHSLVNSLLSLPTCDAKFKLRKQNSFTATKQNNKGDNLYNHKKQSPSVRSEPPLRSYNLPLPDFDNASCQHKSFYGQTISRAEDIRPIGFKDFTKESLIKESFINSRKSQLLSNKNILPDMVTDAIALEHCSKTYQQSSSDEEKQFYNQSSKSPKLKRKKSESPARDYETDSLERMCNKKGLSTPTEYTDVPSSQASPSLSNALPLEEELTMRNAVYKSNSNTPSPFRDITHKNHYEPVREKGLVNINDKPSNANTDYSLVSEVYVNNSYNFNSTPTSPSGSDCSLGSRKLEEKPGSLTIEVKDSPENYIKIHESDDFEPDTLDRKHNKRKETENTHFSRKDLINSLNTKENTNSHRIQLRSSGTFKKPSLSTKFNSLRHIYEEGKNPFERPVISNETFTRSTKSLEDNGHDSWNEDDWETEEGRILTLELRHSKRQRQSTPPTIKQFKSLARPDVLPPLPPIETLYEKPCCPPRKIANIDSKNVNGRSLSPRTFTRSTTIKQVTIQNLPQTINIGPCSPKRASVRNTHSDYENIQQYNYIKGGPSENTSSNGSKSLVSINTNTFVKANKNVDKSTFKRRKGSLIDDSGYLSSDSASSRQIQRKIVISKTVSCSESEDSENEAQSESGAESVETHSVFFDSYRKSQTNQEGNFDRNTCRNSSKKISRPYS